MNIIEERTYRSATLPKAPARATRAEAEADEARGVELQAYLALLPTLTVEQWGAARAAAGDAAWDAAGAAAGDAAGDAARAAARAAIAVVARDLITREQFDILTKPMRAAGVDFDTLVPTTDDLETGEQ